jgi:hypothetical protein
MPVRNAAVNGKLAALVARLGDEAPAVAGFYPTVGNAFYVSRGHDVGTLLRDCESLLGHRGHHGRGAKRVDEGIGNRRVSQASPDFSGQSPEITRLAPEITRLGQH